MQAGTGPCAQTACPLWCPCSHGAVHAVAELSHQPALLVWETGQAPAEGPVPGGLPVTEAPDPVPRSPAVSSTTVRGSCWGCS